MTEDEEANAEWTEKATKIADFARELGLHGVLILSPRCPDCGMLHDWHLMTDAPEEQGSGEQLAGLLRHYAKVVLTEEPEMVEGSRAH